MSTELPDREPLSRREMQRIALQIATAAAVWVFAGGWLVEHYLSAPGWATDAVQFGGALAIAMGIGWWRIIRHGPAGPPRERATGAARPFGSRPREASDGVPYLFGACVAVVMCVALLARAEDDERALEWGLAFGVVAVVQLVRYLRRRR